MKCCIVSFKSETLQNLWTDREVIHSFWLLQTLRPEGYGKKLEKQQLSKNVQSSVASKLKSPIHVGAGFVFFFFIFKYIFIQSLYVTNPESFLWVVRQKNFKIPGKQNGHLKRGSGEGNLALRRQVVTQGNWTHSRTLKPVKQTGAFFPFNQPYMFFLNFLKIFIKKTQKHRLFSLQLCGMLHFPVCSML